MLKNIIYFYYKAYVLYKKQIFISIQFKFHKKQNYFYKLKVKFKYNTKSKKYENVKIE